MKVGVCSPLLLLLICVQRLRGVLKLDAFRFGHGSRENTEYSSPFTSTRNQSRLSPYRARGFYTFGVPGLSLPGFRGQLLLTSGQRVSLCLLTRTQRLISLPSSTPLSGDRGLLNRGWLHASPRPTAPEFRDADISSLSWSSCPKAGLPVSSVGSPLTADPFHDIVSQELSLNNTKTVENIRHKSLCWVCFDSSNPIW